MHKTFRYCGQVTLTTSSTAGLLGTQHQFNLNSLFDPDRTAIGHQPYGYDQLCSSSGPYLKYKVNRARVRLEFTHPNSGDARTYAFVAMRNDASISQSISGASIELVGERAMATKKYVPVTGDQKCVFELDIPIAGALNQSRLAFDSDVDNTAAVSTSSPVWVPTLLVAVGETVTSTAYTVGCLFTIEYDSVLFYRYALPKS
jgi:hypothetical protein